MVNLRLCFGGKLGEGRGEGILVGEVIGRVFFWVG